MAKKPQRKNESAVKEQTTDQDQNGQDQENQDVTAEAETSTNESDDSSEGSENGSAQNSTEADESLSVAGDAEGDVEQPVETEPQEILDLNAAVQKVQDKIAWHKEQIQELYEEVKGHEDQIEELQASLRDKFGGLISSVTPKPAPRKASRKPSRNGGNKQGRHDEVNKAIARTAGGSPTTGDLIVTFLHKRSAPASTNEIKSHLESRGNSTNPSVELSRLVKKGVVYRPERGLYAVHK